jgi:hypothetical protein
LLPDAEAKDMFWKGGPGVLPWRGLGCPQYFLSFPKRFVENALSEGWRIYEKYKLRHNGTIDLYLNATKLA